MILLVVTREARGSSGWQPSFPIVIVDFEDNNYINFRWNIRSDNAVFLFVY